jgi:hypothetical protein
LDDVVIGRIGQRDSNAFKVFNYHYHLNGIPIKPVATVMAGIVGIATNIEEPLNTNPGCRDSEDVTSHLGNSRVFGLKDFPAFQWIGLFKNVQWRCLEIAYRF